MKTVKELIKNQLDWADDLEKYRDLAMPVILETYKEIFTELLRAHENEIEKFPESMFELSLLFDEKLNKILQALKKELVEKDKQLEIMNEQCDGAIREMVEQQLFKEDFIVADFCINCGDELFIIDNMKKRKERKVNKNDKCDTCGWDRIIKLKDNSKYDLLFSREN